MDVIIAVFVGFTVGWFVGALITTIRQAQAFKSILEDLGVTTEQLLKLKRQMDRGEAPQTPEISPVIEVRLERMGDQIYAYRKDTMQFIAQGTDREALVQHLNTTFPKGCIVNITEQDGAGLIKTL